MPPEYQSLVTSYRDFGHTRHPRNNNLHQNNSSSCLTSQFAEQYATADLPEVVATAFGLMNEPVRVHNGHLIGCKREA